jgi:hypothetical protein
MNLPELYSNRLPGVILLALALAGCGTKPTGPVNSSSAGAASSKQPASAAGQSGRKETNVVTTVPKSVFHLDAQVGRDPFFPGASRSSAPTAVASQQQHLPLSSYLKLAGLYPGTARPMALINKTSLAPGEEGDVSIVVSNQLSKAEIKKVSVRCLAIRQDSVLIKIAGEPDVKELRLGQKK